jgi:hypothetical protein
VCHQRAGDEGAQRDVDALNVAFKSDKCGVYDIRAYRKSLIHDGVNLFMRQNVAEY